jgi:hypothetical protein
LRAARANHVFCTDKKRIRTKNAVVDKGKDGSGLLLYKIVDCVRTGLSSAQDCNSAATRGAELRAARANRVLGTDKKRIRTKNTVLVKSNNGWGLLSYTIVDCVRTGSSSVRNRRSARTVFRPRKIAAITR